jgi:transcription antitermination factor NusA-like protein
VIGRAGAKISEISKLSGARIQVPKAEDLPFPADEDDDAMVDVSIEGDAVAAKIALDEIRKIVNERTSTMNARLRDIPAELYPFLAGPNNSGIERFQQGRDVQINIPHYYSWSHQPPPQIPSHDVIPSFNSHPNRHIQISGDRIAVQEARAEIERQAEQLKREITLSQLPINRGQRQFVVGPDGAALHDLLSQTGCSVIIPPDSDDSEILYVIGPRSQIDRGLEEVMNLATSMQMANINIGHPNDAAHAHALTRYLQQRRAIEQLEKTHSSHIVVPTRADGSTAWEVYSREGKNTIRARTDIMSIAKAYPPSRFRHVEMDPFFHERLRSHHRERVQRDHGVHLMMPSQSSSPQGLVLVYEGPNVTELTELSRTAPTAQEISNFERALRAAEQEILALAAGHASIETREIEVPHKFQDKVRKFVRTEQQGLPIDIPPLQVTSTSPSSKAATEMLLRGPQDRLDAMAAKISDFVEQEKRDEVERGFTMSFEFPQKFANFLIGKRGENINKLRDEFDVEIQVKDGQVELKGPKAKAEACKARIMTMSKKLEDEVTYVLKVAPKYHRELIGAKGTQVQRLEDRYNVRVQFPRSAHVPSDSDSLVDGSDAGTARNSRTNQAPDEVIVRGPKKGADACREELLSLLQYTIDTSQTATVSVAKKQIPQIIGQGGKEMENIRQTTGAKIDIPNGDTPTDAAGRVELKIKGTKKQVEDARKLLEEKAKIFDETVQRSIQVDKKYHKALIGGGGEYPNMLDCNLY